MFDYIETRNTLMTPEKAKEFLVDNGFAGQRRLDPGHVEHLASEMRKGEYLTGHFVYARTPDGKNHVMNGQHSAWGICESGCTVRALIEGFACDSMDDLWRLFAKFDRHKSRTVSDIVRASRTSMDEEIRQIPQGVVSHVGLSLAMLNLGGVPEFSSRGIETERRIAAIAKHRDITLFVADFASSKMCARLPVRMAMAATFDSSPVRARYFWERVIDGEGLAANDPRLLLRAVLLNSGGRGKSSARACRQLFATCLLHYNAYVDKAPVVAHNFDGPLPKIAVSNAPLYTIHPPIPQTKPQTFTDALVGLAAKPGAAIASASAVQ